MNGAFYERRLRVEGVWNTGREEEGGNQGYKIAGSRAATSPSRRSTDQSSDLREPTISAATSSTRRPGAREAAHHEVGTGGQAEINYKFNTLTAGR